MPSPLEYSYRVIKPFALENSTPPVHQKSYVNGTRFKPSNTLGGAATGGSFGGVYGAAAGAAVGLVSDIWQAVYAKKRAKEANEEARRAADVASARASQEARIARAYNSEQSQIRRMRMAGLSPGLAYGQMSPSTATAAPQEKADVYKSDTPKFDNESILHALQLLINQQNANTQAAAQVSTSDLQSTQAQLNRIESQFKAQEKLAGISAVLAQKDLTDEEKLSVISKRLPEIELLTSQSNLAYSNANLANQNAAYVGPLADSLMNLQDSEAALNVKKSFTESERPYEIRAHINLMDSQRSYYNAQSNLLRQTYGVSQGKIDAVAEWLDSHGYSKSYIGYAMQFLDDVSSHVGSSIAESSVKTLFSWLSADNWLSFISSRSNASDFIESRERVSAADRESSERVAAGHDATRLESVERLLENGAKVNDSARRTEFNKYREEYILLNDKNKKFVTDRMSYFESQGYSESDISERIGWLTHILYLEQQSNKRK